MPAAALTDVAVLGLGRMGRPMAAALARAGHRVTVWNRTPAIAEEFADQHAAVRARDPAIAAAAADVVVSVLADDRAVLDTYEGTDGVLAGLRSGTVAVDMSTVSPATARHLAGRVDTHGAAFLDAPVSGSVDAAAAGALTIMVGGAAQAVDAARPVLSTLGATTVHVGGPGSGAALKLSVNSILHGLNAAVSEALVLAERAGIDRRAAYAVYRQSAIAAPFVHHRQPFFEQPDGAGVAFRLALAAKDLRLVLQLADDVGAELPQTAVNLRLLDRAVDAGLGERDETALAEHLRHPPAP